MLPSEPWEPVEVGVGGRHGASMLYRDCGVLSVGYQFSRGPGLAAQSLEYFHVVGAWAHETRLRPFQERRYETK